MIRKFDPITEDVLKCVEDFWGFMLPKDYRNYLLAYTGDIPSNLDFNFKGQKNGSTLSCLYGFYSGYENILKSAEEMGHRYPTNLLPIGDDVCGNRILLSVQGSDRGKVYFWDHESEVDEGEKPNYSNVTLISDSFTDFIQSFYDYNS